MVSQRNEAFQANWQRFTRLDETSDILASERIGDRRWRWLLPDIAFVIPVVDEAAVAQCIEWQQALHQWFEYEPQPPERLHITLHYVGDLRRHFWQWRLTTWGRASLRKLAERAGAALADVAPFEVLIGPLNAFPGGLFAEVHGDDHQLDRMRDAIKAALPWRASLLYIGRAYLPHVTLGYWGHQPVGPLVNALRRYREIDAVPLRVERVKFTIYARDAVPLRSDVLRTAREEVIAEYRLQPADVSENMGG